MMIHLVALLFCFAAILNAQEPITSVFQDIDPYCNERCPEGFEYVEELGDCFKLLLDLGPVSQDRGVIACALNNGSGLPTFQKRGEEDILRAYFFEKYGNQISGTPGNTPQAGFWTAYVRKAGDGVTSSDNFESEYLNLYSGSDMNNDLWAAGQPNNDNLDQVCVARKRFGKEYINKQKKSMTEDDVKAMNGLDDYHCSYPHWVICVSKRHFALNKRAYNTRIMAGEQEGGECQLDWPTQTAYQFEMMINAATNESAWEEVANLEAIKDTIETPVFEDICKPGENYKCD